MSPMNPKHAYPAHYNTGDDPRSKCGTWNPVRITDDPTLVTCKRCRRAMDKIIAQVLDEAKKS